MNKLILRSSIGILGIALGVATVFGTWRNLVFGALGSGLIGSSLLAILVAVVGTTIGLLITYNSLKFLFKNKGN